MKLLPVNWSESFAAAIAVALGSDIDFVRDEVERGICQAWEFICDGEILGHVITRLEPDTLVVVAYEGTDVLSFGDLIVRVCEHKNLKWARFHTTRPGLNRLLAELKPEPIEYVMRIECYGR